MTDIATRLQNLIEADPDPAMVELYTTSLREIERLRAIEQAADKAYRYHMLGYKDPEDFNANVMLDLMNELGAAL